jgi:hypothetical protein
LSAVENISEQWDVWTKGFHFFSNYKKQY